MSLSPLTLASSVALGLSAAQPGQLGALRQTLDRTTPPPLAGKANERKVAGGEEERQGEQGLTPAEQRRVAELKRIDAEVRAHEQAHVNVGRELITSGPNYTYTYGPDGKQYAISGEVSIDTSPEPHAQANIDKGQRIQDTALAPTDPSPQDRSVAATGRRLEAQGRSDLREERQSVGALPADTPALSRLRAYASAPPPDRQLDVYI